jgi:catechol 2,3-dioxygenase-like lactoylglutathione lyase family enzyme
MLAGFSHIGLATPNMDATLAFYTDVLGFKIVRYDNMGITEGGNMRHVFLDCGRQELLSFLGPEGVDALPEWHPGINQGLGVPRGFYHFAFNCESEEALGERQENLMRHGITVSDFVDHDWCKSIYFDDPVNLLSLEYSTLTRPFNEDDRTLSTRFEAPIALFDYDRTAWINSEKARFEVLKKRGLLSDTH